jgi:hypothetical protein
MPEPTRTRRIAALPVLVLALVPIGCAGNQVDPLGAAFATADAQPGWAPRTGAETYDAETIFDLVDGQADLFFAYNLEQVTAGSYESDDGALMYIEVWQLATQSDAYGLFSSSITGEPIDVGSDGDADEGRRISFWQDRFVAHVRALQQTDQAVITAFAQAISGALPSGGQAPAIVERLPQEGLVARSAIFFHREISIQNELWLGGTNLLGLGSDTDGVLAQYEIGGTTARLLLVSYPHTGSAASAAAALVDSDLGVAAAGNKDELMAGVFGQVSFNEATSLIGDALSPETE